MRGKLEACPTSPARCRAKRTARYGCHYRTSVITSPLSVSTDADLRARRRARGYPLSPLTTIAPLTIRMAHNQNRWTLQPAGCILNPTAPTRHQMQ
jgi:hypothetical protein